MKLLKWLFNPLYLLIAIIAVVIFVNRDLLFGGASAGSSAQGAASAPAQPVAVRAELPVQPHKVAEAKPHNPSAGAPSAPAAQSPAPGAHSATGGPARPPLAPVQPAPAPQESAGATAAAAGPDPALSLWYKARQLAWEGKSEEAVTAYQQLIEKEPGNFDAYGELGNVYLQLGRWQAAAEAYHRAALLLQGAGNSMMAWHLQRIVFGLDREHGDRLRDALLHRGETKQ